MVLWRNEDRKARNFSKQGSTEGSCDFWPKLSSGHFHSTTSNKIVNNVDIYTPYLGFDDMMALC